MTTLQAIERLIEYARKRGVRTFSAAKLEGIGEQIAFAFEREAFTRPVLPRRNRDPLIDSEIE